MSRTWLPVLLLIGFVIVNAMVILLLSHLTMRVRPTPVKLTPYEAGMPPIGDARERFSVKFYMVAISFIVFDVEAVFLFPWAAHYRQLSCSAPLGATGCPDGALSAYGFWAMFVFVVVLALGLVYEWKKGGFQWQ